jgi:hypothetical protein
MKIPALVDLPEHQAYASLARDVRRTATVEAVMFSDNLIPSHARMSEWGSGQSDDARSNATKLAAQSQKQAYEQMYVRFLDLLGMLNPACYIVPSHLHAPERIFLQPNLSSQAAAPVVALVHRSFTPHERDMVTASSGSRRIAEMHDTVWTVEYPSWEAEFSFNFLHSLSQDCILFFEMPLEASRSDVSRDRLRGRPTVETLIKVYMPKNFMANPSPVGESCYAVFDTQESKMYFCNI